MSGKVQEPDSVDSTVVSSANPLLESTKGRKRHHGTVLRKTEDSEKKFSDGVRGTVTSICRYWWKEKPGAVDFVLRETRQTIEIFLKNFSPVYEKIQKHYGGISQDTNLEKKVIAINGGHTEMPFYQMRAYAEYVGLPTGLLLLFTNLLSDATQGHGREDLVNLLTSSAASINALIATVDNNKINDLLFKEIQCDEEGLEYIAKLQGLEAMSKAFRLHRKLPEKK